jgi:beta-N-acetylhexosaminidase
MMRTGAAILSLTAVFVLMGPADPATVAPADLGPEAQRWVDETLARMTLEEKIGQLVFPSFFSEYTSSESETYEHLVRLIHDYHVGGMLVFGVRERRPDVLLNRTYPRNSRGEPLNAASLINRLQAVSRIPLLVTADFETGIGFRMNGGTTFPRAMAFGAAGAPELAYEAGRITAIEGRGVGVHVNLAPVVDVNNNPGNPVINTRSFGEDPARVGAIAAAYIAGLQAGGMLATVKHFPGHGDTDVDSHFGLPLIAHPRERLNRIELPPFRDAIAAGADGVMTGHIQLPNLEPDDATPATFSSRIVGQLLRGELGFQGLVFTDSMRMRAVTEIVPPGEAAGRAVAAGHDVVLHSVDDAAAFDGIRTAVASGAVTEDRLDASVVRILAAKARLGLHTRSKVDLDTLPLLVGTRQNLAVAEAISTRSITLLKDDREDVPLEVSRSADVLYLSVVDGQSGRGVTVPSAAFIPELEKRWPNVTSVELSNRTAASELELVQETASRYDAVIVGLFAQAPPDSQMGLSGDIVRMLRRVADQSTRAGQPFVAIVFGNPYVAAFLEALPALMLTYDVADLAQVAAARALAGERAIEGRLPIRLGDPFPLGHGLDREAP